MKKLIQLTLILTLVVVGIIGTSSIALADPPDVVGPNPDTAWLCPAVGGPHGNGPFAGGPLPGGQLTFLPGHNQAGAHANSHGVNPDAPGDSPGPGNGNNDWSPLWPPTVPEP